MDNLNPSFVTSFIIEYRFEAVQRLLIKIYDWSVSGVTMDIVAMTWIPRRDTDSSNPDEQDYLGEAETTIGHIAGARGQSLTLRLTNPSQPESEATVTITGSCARIVCPSPHLHLVRGGGGGGQYAHCTIIGCVQIRSELM